MSQLNTFVEKAIAHFKAKEELQEVFQDAYDAFYNEGMEGFSEFLLTCYITDLENQYESNRNEQNT